MQLITSEMIYPTLGILSLITGAMTKILGDTSGSRLAPRTMLGTRAYMMSEERRVIESDKLLRAVVCIALCIA